MSFHRDFEEWERFSRPEGCPVCQNVPEPEDRVTIWEFPTSWRVAHPRRALKAVTGAVKIDYEIHGNTIPHLHMHLCDDPFPGAPIDFRQVTPPVYGEGEFAAFVTEMRDLLSARMDVR